MTIDTDRPPDSLVRGVLEKGTGLAAPFFAAVQFLTVIPPLVRRTFTPAELGWSLVFFPIVGGVLGGLLIGLDRLTAMLFPAPVSAALVLAGWVVLTGGLHLDGFLDTCDGLLGGRTPENRLRIMRDERVGAYAVIGGMLLILVKFNALLALVNRDMALLLAPMLGRWTMVLAVVALPYARPDGLGRDMKDHAGWVQALLASLIVVPVALWAGSWLGLIALGVVLTTLVAGAGFVLRRIPGLTGDIYGCFCELAEVLVLLTLVAGAAA